VNLQFRSRLEPPAPLIEEVGACDPTNPFHTSEYVKASGSVGEQACLLGLYQGDKLVSGCLGFLSGTFLRHSLVIPSLPAISNPEIFWPGLLDFCHESKIWRLQIDTYASPAGEIPRLPGELERRARCEFVIDLEHAEVADGLNSQHRRNVSRAIKAGISVRRTSDAAACSEHLKMMDASMERRASRGEEIEKDNDARTRALLFCRAGELFQAVHEEKTVSSVLILRAVMGAYYHTAGTSADGMKMGASPFLLARTAEALKQEGCRVFNLGGAAPENPGLQRFKSGFGARQVGLEAASFCPRSEVKRKVHRTLRMGWEWIRQE
jgi:hypothetical protein